MGLLNSLIDITSAAVKVALTPVAIVTDVTIKVVTGENPQITEGTIKSAGKDFVSAADEITGTK